MLQNKGGEQNSNVFFLVPAGDLEFCLWGKNVSGLFILRGVVLYIIIPKLLCFSVCVGVGVREGLCGGILKYVTLYAQIQHKQLIHCLCQSWEE